LADFSGTIRGIAFSEDGSKIFAAKEIWF
jgi:hypothetical protein